MLTFAILGQRLVRVTILRLVLDTKPGVFTDIVRRKADHDHVGTRDVRLSRDVGTAQPT